MVRLFYELIDYNLIQFCSFENMIKLLLLYVVIHDLTFRVYNFCQKCN